MKERIKLLTLVSSILFALISCNKLENVALEEAPPQILTQMQEDRIDRGNFTLSSDDAIKVALLNNINSAETKSANVKTVKDVVTIKGKSDTPLLYAVNYTDNKGFTLVSASKSYYPILAMVEKGEFGPDCYKTGMAVLLDEYEKGIEYCKTLPEDSLKTFKALWCQYEKSEQKALPQTKSEIMSLISQSTAQWTNDGYEFMSLEETNGTPPWDMPLSLYTQWCEIAETFGNPNYDSEVYSFILYDYRTEIDTIPQMLRTTWGQEGRYNDSLSFINGILPPAGCVAVAMGQIMKYHQWPNIFNWSIMPNNYSSEETARLLAHIGSNVQMNYGLSVSTSNIVNATYAFNMYYNYSALFFDYSKSMVDNSLRSGCPVYMTGRDQSQEVAHAWVCDGKMRSTIGDIYKLMIVYLSSPLSYIQQEFNQDNVTDGSSYYHMNWGEYGAGDGWFIDGDGQVVEHNYTINRKILICEPNN